MTKRKIEYWVIPPEQDAEFVACMEEVLETYAEAYDPQRPVLCMDEQPVQLLKETKVPIPATKQHGERVDYEYERNGTASIFMFAEPLSGFRQATAREHRTKTDWAIEVAQLLDTRYADCETVILVSDNLNTHTKGAFYEAFPPERARAYVKRLDFRHTPKHGSWLNIAECELSCLTSQCLSGRRLGELPLLQSEIAIWAEKTTAKHLYGLSCQVARTPSVVGGNDFLSRIFRPSRSSRGDCFRWGRRLRGIRSRGGVRRPPSGRRAAPNIYRGSIPARWSCRGTNQRRRLRRHSRAYA